MNRSLRLAVPAAALAVLAAPAAAHAQTASLVPGTQCIRFVTAAAQTLPIQGSGFAPNASVSLLSGGVPFASVVADPAGGFTQAVPAPPITGTRANVSLTADDGQGHVAGPVQLPEVRLGVEWPSRGKPRSRVLFRAYGFEPGKTVYLHIRRGGKTLGRFKIGKGDAPCGVTKRRMAVMPLRSYRPGTYEYWFGNTKRYDRSKEIGYRVTITRSFRGLNAIPAAPAPRWGSLSSLSLTG